MSWKKWIWGDTVIKVLHTPLKTKRVVKTVVNEETHLEEQVEIIEKANPVVKYDIKARENGLCIVFSAASNDYGKLYEVELDYEEYAGKIIEISLVRSDVVDELKVYPVFHRVVQHTGIQNSSKSRMDKGIARIVFDPACKNIVIALLQDSDDIPGCENVVYDLKERSTTGMLVEHSKYFAELFQKRKTKAQMINEVDIYATITYLESQVDALTRIVLKLAPESEEKRILDWANQYSVLDMKKADAIIKEIKQDKGDIRRLQRVYYDAKKKL